MTALASPHHRATEAGLRALADGGSAVDAALAAAAVLTVVYPHNCALGGDLIAIVRAPDGTSQVVNATGRAAAGTSAAALRAAHGDRLPVTGIDTVTVPGLVAGWGALHERGGRRDWAAALADAHALARDGVPVTAKLAAAIAETPGVLHDPGMRAVFTRDDGTPLAAGDTLRQPALAATLAALAADGPRALYAGPLAAALAEGLAALGSAITADDLAAYRPTVEAPLRAPLADGTELLTAGPNSSGVLLAQALLALEHARPADPLGAGAGVTAAIFAAGTRQREEQLGDPQGAGWDRDAWLGPDPIARLAGDARAGRIARPATGAPRPAGDTVAVVATDADGGAVSLIQSLYHGFGAQLLEPRTGILLHNRGTAFSLAPGHPNAIAPGRRPMHTLMPVTVERDGALVGVLGTMGGRVQAQIHTQLLLRLRAGATAAEAVAAPRFAVGPMEEGDPPHTVRVEEDAPPQLREALLAAGLLPVTVPRHSEWLGHAQAIWDGVAGTDPRADGQAPDDP